MLSIAATTFPAFRVYGHHTWNYIRSSCWSGRYVLGFELLRTGISRMTDPSIIRHLTPDSLFRSWERHRITMDETGRTDTTEHQQEIDHLDTLTDCPLAMQQAFIATCAARVGIEITMIARQAWISGMRTGWYAMLDAIRDQGEIDAVFKGIDESEIERLVRDGSSAEKRSGATDGYHPYFDDQTGTDTGSGVVG